MNYCGSCSVTAVSCQQPKIPTYPIHSCGCVSCDPQIEKLFPASTKPVIKRQLPKCVPSKKQAPKLNDKKRKSCIRQTVSLNPNCHPADCACSECDKCVDTQELTKENDNLNSQDSICDMSSLHSEKSIKDYMHDNPKLSDAKYRKSMSLGNISDCADSNNELWVLQCPKGFDPNTIINTKLGKLSKDDFSSIDLTAKRFEKKMTLACLTPEKAAEYEVICDSIKILRPVGKITVIECEPQLPKKASKRDIQKPVEVAESCSDADDDQKPIASKKVEKQFNDQKFTIETTVTVENCGDRKGKKRNKESCGECLPIAPPEPLVPSKKSKKKKSTDDDIC